ncbi:MAG: hypothetical protein DMG36_24610 [Acidobacteria bacterium]|nr:MAG: hypothetical protein DMG36_24610 [Acidobacteriota bacterium]
MVVIWTDLRSNFHDESGNPFTVERARDFLLAPNFRTRARHQLQLLTTPEFPGGHPEALEMLGVAGRVPDAEGVLIHSVGDVTLFLALSDFRISKLNPS